MDPLCLLQMCTMKLRPDNANSNYLLIFACYIVTRTNIQPGAKRFENFSRQFLYSLWKIDEILTIFLFLPTRRNWNFSLTPLLKFQLKCCFFLFRSGTNFKLGETKNYVWLNGANSIQLCQLYLNFLFCCCLER